MSQQIVFMSVWGEPTEINVLWSDCNNVSHGGRVEIEIVGNDRDRRLCVRVNGVTVADVPCSEVTQSMAAEIRQLVGN